MDVVEGRVASCLPDRCCQLSGPVICASPGCRRTALAGDSRQLHRSFLSAARVRAMSRLEHSLTVLPLGRPRLPFPIRVAREVHAGFDGCSFPIFHGPVPITGVRRACQALFRPLFRSCLLDHLAAEREDARHSASGCLSFITTAELPSRTNEATFFHRPLGHNRFLAVRSRVERVDSTSAERHRLAVREPHADLILIDVRRRIRLLHRACEPQLDLSRRFEFHQILNCQRLDRARRTIPDCSSSSLSLPWRRCPNAIPRIALTSQLRSWMRTTGCLALCRRHTLPQRSRARPQRTRTDTSSL